MIDWHEIARHAPIRRLGEIIRRHLNVWSGFIERSGAVVVVGGRQPVEKPLCDAFMSRHDELGSCRRSLRGWVDGLREGRLQAEGPQVVGCHAGLKSVLVPVSFGGEVIGACYASGFVLALEEESTAEIERRGDTLDISRGTLRQGQRTLPKLDGSSLRLLGELCQAMVDEALLMLGERVTEASSETPMQRRDYAEIIAESDVMLRLFKLIGKVSQSEATVLLQGEPGTGKELVARAIHFNSSRRDEAFVVQNCSAINDSLLDSELFGHKKGSFTGSISDKHGLFELADQGTFFLDEIGDMSPTLQVKLLRVLQEGTFQPVGGSIVHKVDVRIIAATNRDLHKMVQDGSFRRDLFYRLNVINIRLPALRERREDIGVLVEHFLRVHSANHGRGVKLLSAACLERMEAYHWPGNVRELENEIERLVVLSGDEGAIPESLLSPRLRRADAPSPHIKAALGATLPDKLPAALEMVERHMILESLKETGWNKTRTAKALGISRRNLIRKVGRYELERFRQ